MWETRSVFHIPMPRLLRQDGLRRGRPVAQRRVRSLRVVFHPPPLRQNLCLLQRVKDLAVQEFISQLSVEAFTVPVFPWTPRFDVQRLGTQIPLFLRYLQPFASPDPLHSILSHRPPRIPQQCRDAPVAVAPILSR